MAPRVFHSDSRTWSNFQPAELVKLCGVSQGQWPVYVLKELVDNAIAVLEEHGHPRPMVTVSLIDGYISVSENGPGISDAILDQVLDFDRFGGSNRHHKLPTRGAQGNAWMTIVGIATAWSDDPFLVVRRPSGPELQIKISLDQVRQTVKIEREETGPAAPSEIMVPIPELPWKRGGTTMKDLTAMVRTMAWMNPHVTFRLRTPEGTAMIASVADAGPAMPGSPACGAAAWFTDEEFAARLAADVRARPSVPLNSWIREFYGVPKSFTMGPEGPTAIGVLLAGKPEVAFVSLAKIYRGIVNQHADAKRVGDPKFEAVGAERLAAFLISELGADPESDVEYHAIRSVDSQGVPNLVEVCLVQMPERTKQAPDPVLCMNRTVLYGSPPLRGAKWREKVYGDWHGFNGDLNGLAHAYGLDVGKTSSALVVHVTCPSPRYSGYGKQSFDASWLVEPLSDALERVTVKVRKQRMGDARRPKGSVDSSIRETVHRLLPDLWEQYTEGGNLAITLRNMYYAVRKGWARHHSKKLEYPTFTTYAAEYEEKIGRVLFFRDARGTLIEPHSGKVLRLGTKDSQKYRPSRWEGHTIVFVEKEGLADLMKEYGIGKRYDAVLVGSKGFAVESCREVLQMYRKLLGDEVKIIALHDADPAGYGIGYDLATNLPRFGESVDVKVIDVGLTITDAIKMELQDEPFELKKPTWSMVKNMRRKLVTEPDGRRRPLFDDPAWDYFMPDDLRYDEYPTWIDHPEGRRVELNAMAPRQFITWLEEKLDANGCKKVRPPDDIVDERLRNARDNHVRNEVGSMLMSMLGESMIPRILEELGDPTHNLDDVLARKPEQHWEAIVKRAGETGMDLKPIIEKLLREKIAGGIA